MGGERRAIAFSKIKIEEMQKKKKISNIHKNKFDNFFFSSVDNQLQQLQAI